MRSTRIAALCLSVLLTSTGAAAAAGAPATTNGPSAGTYAGPTPCAELEVIAHRGVHSPRIASNSMRAFQLAAQNGFSVETDVWADAQGVLWVFHDRNARADTGVDKNIPEMRTARVERLRYLTDGSPLVRLDDAMELFSTVPDLPLYIEIKQPSNAAPVSNLIRASDRLHSTWITAFVVDTRAADPDVRILLKANPANPAPSPERVQSRSADTVALTPKQLNPAAIDELQMAGISVQVRNSQNNRVWRRAILAGVNGQLTDAPQRLRSYCPGALVTPVIDRFSPTNGNRGTVITIRGSYFTDAHVVRIGRVRLRHSVVSDSKITAKIKATAPRRGFVKVSDPNGTGASSSVFRRR